MLKFVKQIKVNLSICPKKTEGATNGSEMAKVERLLEDEDWMKKALWLSLLPKPLLISLGFVVL